MCSFEYISITILKGLEYGYLMNGSIILQNINSSYLIATSYQTKQTSLRLL